MELTFDLGLHRVKPRLDGERRTFGLYDVQDVARDRRALRSLLRGTRYDRVEVLYDTLPRSVARAAGLVIAAFLRTRRFELRGDGQRRPVGRLELLVRGAAAVVAALAMELVRGPRLTRRAHAAAAASVELPREARDARSVAYLRTDFTLRWMGDYVGGSATHTTGVVSGLAANGLDVQVVAPEPLEGVGDIGFTEVPLERSYHLAPWLTPIDYTDAVAAAAPRADVVYQRYSLGSTAGLEHARRLGVPLVLEFNGSEVWASSHWGEGRSWRSDLPAEIERRNLRDASLIVVVSDVLRDQLVEHGVDAERILVNPNGVDVDRLAPLRERSPSQWRAELDRPAAPTVGFVGTFGLWHGVKLLPAMIAALRERVPDARWTIIGAGPLHTEVREEVARRGLADAVLMPGVLPHDEALRLLASCDVFVSPHVPNPDGSRFFGSPTKLFEYMGLARPIVASDLEQIGEVLEHESTALLHEPGDIDASADAIARLLGDPGLRDRLAAAALEEAERTYTWRAHVERILARLGTAAAVRS